MNGKVEIYKEHGRWTCKVDGIVIVMSAPTYEAAKQAWQDWKKQQEARKEYPEPIYHNITDRNG